MKWTRLVLICVTLLLVTCGPSASPEPVAEQPVAAAPLQATEEPTEVPPPTDAPPTEAPPPTEVPPTEAPPPTDSPSPTTAPPAEPSEPVPTVAIVDQPGLPLPSDRGQLFSASGTCAVCHTQMEDEAGADVSTDTFWRASMMANAARDPYWLASVRAESLTNPHLQAVIEDKCATCHMPMAWFSTVAEGGAGKVLDDGFGDKANDMHNLAVDGVSCTVCHQIREDGFGEADSFGGGFAIDTEIPAGERESFGPFPAPEDQVAIMQGASGFVPIESPHVEEAGLCATCHTLYTPYVDADGEVAGVFPEQMAYFEWLSSAFAGSVSCQGCHMPPAEGAVQLSITGSPPRSPAHQHVFVGGNAYMLEILKAFGEELAVTSSTAQFQGKQEQAAEQLQTRAASLKLEDAVVDGSSLSLNAATTSMVGHKFPTGFPSRRVWIHLAVQDDNGDVVFESGAVSPNGSIVGNDNDADPAAYEPHYSVIDSPEQVQIYETIIGDTETEVTTVLLLGAGYLKDNRLLPSGFDKAAAGADIAVHGAALDDEDFAGGGDRVQYTIDLGDATGPFTVTAELLYQSIGYRWAENLGSYDAAEPQRFIEYYDQVPNVPVPIATVTLEVE